MKKDPETYIDVYTYTHTHTHTHTYTYIYIHIHPAGPETVPIKRTFFLTNGDFTTVPC